MRLRAHAGADHAQTEFPVFISHSATSL